MKLKYQLVMQEIAGTYMAAAIGTDARKYNNVINLNETGKVILELLQQDTTEEDIVKELQSRYEGDEQVIRKSVKAVLNKLSDEGLLA